MLQPEKQKTPATIREAVGVFSDARAFEDAIDELLSAGFDRAEISLLASPEAVDEKLGQRYRRSDALEDDPTDAADGLCRARERRCR